MSVTGRLIATVALTLLFGWGMFALAGRWDWFGGWSYLAVLTVGGTVNEWLMARMNPELFRMRGRTGPGTKGWDKLCLALFALAILGIFAVAALDAGRYGWAPAPAWTWPIGLMMAIAGQAVLSWAMLNNRFFEKTVRIQSERGHRVIDTGPYAHIRHPGYTGVILGILLSAPLLMGSLWTWVPAVLASLVLVIRTALEDRTLRAELDGYEAYAARVRYRLFPGIW